MRHFRSLIGKELESYFGSPMALIFLGIFLIVTLYVFFWVEAFFAGGLAEIRGLFQWMPILLIFLISALTMRQWSEEQRSGTLETLLTLPVSTLALILAKFVAVLLMVCLALALTLPLPITVSNLGNLDWGPVIAGYLATLLLSAAYIAIGLFASSRTDNQIVALMLTVIMGGILYFAGTGTATEFVAPWLAELLRAVGTDSRFQSIQRGVLDARDLLYYATLTGIFLALNFLSIQSIRWSRGHDRVRQRETILVSLVILNLVMANVWMYPLRILRLDVTQQREFSLSSTTRDLLRGLNEPLIIQGFFSERTHPLLGPVVPGIEDMLAEYDIAGGALVNVRVLDPATDPDLELDANKLYGIQPIPFQVAERYETSVRNSYFHVLIRHADQHVVLSTDDLVEIRAERDGSTTITTNTLEYNLTRAIKQVVYGFQSVEAVLESLDEPVKLSLIVTPAFLSDQLALDMETIVETGQELMETTDGLFLFEVVDPDAEDSPYPRDVLIQTYGLPPHPPSVDLIELDTEYYFHLLLEMNNKLHLLFLQGMSVSRATLRDTIDATIQRNSPGFLRTVGLWLPPDLPVQNILGQQLEGLSSWNQLGQALLSEYQVERVDLEAGLVPDHIDVLLLIAPQFVSDRGLFAIDQYLMRGGSTIVAAASHVITPDPLNGNLSLQGTFRNIHDLLAHHGITVGAELVMDLQSTSFPVTVARQVNNLSVNEYRSMDYPFFLDIRADAMAEGHPVVSTLAAVTLNYASPVVLDEAKNAERDTTVLLRSSADSWLVSEIDIQPDFETHPELGFAVAPEAERGSNPLAVAVQGQFTSYFTDRPNPWLESAETETETETEESLGGGEFRVIPVSPDDTRLVVLGSAEFVDDIILDLMSILGQDQAAGNLLLVQNLVDWTQEDAELLSIRARGNTVRVLQPLSNQEQVTVEIMNYFFALLALVIVAAVWRWRSSHQVPLDQQRQQSI